MLMGNFDQAQALTQKLYNFKKEHYGPAHVEYALGLEQLATMNLATGKYAEADENIVEMLRVFEENPYKRRVFDPQYAGVLETSARYNALMGLYKTATSQLFRANRLNKRNTLSLASTSARDELADLYIRTGNYRKIESMVEDAIEVRNERYGAESRFLIAPYNQLARVQYIKGEYLLADSLVNKSLEIGKAIFGEEALQLSEPIHTKADILSAMGNYAEAEELLLNLADLQKELLGDNHVELATTYIQLALVEAASDDHQPEDVLKLLNQSLEITKSNLGEDNPVYAASLTNRAVVLSDLGQYDQALIDLQLAKNIWDANLGNKRNINTASIMLLEGDIFLKQDKALEAIDRYGEARSEFSKLFNRTHPSYVQSVSRLSRAYYSLGNYKKSTSFANEAIENYLNYINEFFPALSTKERTRYWVSIKNDFEFYASLAMQHPKKDVLGNLYNQVLATKSLLISSSLKVRNQILNSGDSVLISDYLAWIEKKEELTQVLALSEEQQREENLNPRNLQREIDDLERELNQKSEGFASSKQIYNWKDIKNQLQPGEVAVEMLRHRHFTNQFTDSAFYTALIVRHNSSAPEIVTLRNGDDLENKFLAYYRSSIQFDIKDDRSFNEFWAPIAAVVEEGTVVYFSPDGVFSQINLEAIPVDEAEYIIDQYDIVLLTSTYEITDKDTEGAAPAGAQAVLVGNPVFYADLMENEYITYTNRPVTQLPGTMAEVNEVGALLASAEGFNPTLLVTEDATENRVKELKSPTVFHIATHGFFLEDKEIEGDENDLQQEKAVVNPLLRSGLLLRNAGDLIATDNVYEFNKAEGILTAYEAMNLNLDNTKLVILSACETGRGDNKVGEGVYGLQRAFLVAGAEALIMSLFEVSDEATKQLMLFFYENWVNKKMSKRKAFSEAKIQLRDQYPEPVMWGSFIMIGI
jgi:CHAT domain-containing protein/predicted negative regulator of RcsB-dependent stress response